MKPFEERGIAIVKRLPPGARMAEIGVLLGKLSEYILLNSDARVTMVDSWAPTQEQPDRYKATNDTHAFADRGRAAATRVEALERVRPFGDRVTVLDMWSDQAAGRVQDGSLNLVFLDADHSYEGVKADLASWVPKVKPGGWIGGHDYDNGAEGYDFSGVKRAVDEWASAWGVVVELDSNFCWFARL